MNKVIRDIGTQLKTLLAPKKVTKTVEKRDYLRKDLTTFYIRNVFEQ